MNAAEKRVRFTEEKSVGTIVADFFLGRRPRVRRALKTLAGNGVEDAGK